MLVVTPSLLSVPKIQRNDTIYDTIYDSMIYSPGFNHLSLELASKGTVRKKNVIVKCQRVKPGMYQKYDTVDDACQNLRGDSAFR